MDLKQEREEAMQEKYLIALPGLGLVSLWITRVEVMEQGIVGVLGGG